MRPNTMRSVNELPPRRLPPCTPPVTSPHANRLGMGSPASVHTCASVVMHKPPMV